jgi:hypothetical protein
MAGKPRYSEEAAQAIREKIMLVLKLIGPSLAHNIAEILGMKTRAVTWFLNDLRRSEEVYVNKKVRISYKHDWSCLWGIGKNTDKDDMPKNVKPQMTKETGITAEDIEWLAYYRLPRAERRARAVQHLFSDS